MPPRPGRNASSLMFSAYSFLYYPDPGGTVKETMHESSNLPRELALALDLALQRQTDKSKLFLMAKYYLS